MNNISTSTLDQQHSVIESIMPLFFDAIQIDHFTYCLEKQNKIHAFSTQPFFIEETRQNKYINSNCTSVLNTKKTSEAILEYIENRDYMSKNHRQSRIVLHHSQYIEHIYISTSDTSIDINKILLENKVLRKMITQFIRNYLQSEEAQQNTITIDCNNNLNETQCPKSRWYNDVSDNKNRSYLYGLNGLCYLTQMEMECLLMHMRLMTHKEIATALNISPKTIENHLANLKRKLGITVKSELFSIVKNNDLI